jgi:transposase
MIEADKRKAIYLLHQEGMSIRQIARRLRVSGNTVRRVIEQKGQMPTVVHADKLHIDEQLLRDLYQQCQGRIQRMHELLTEEHKIPVSYPTLTRMLHHRLHHCPGRPTNPCGRFSTLPALLQKTLPEVLPRL